MALNKTVIDMLRLPTRPAFPIYTKTGGQSLSGADVFPGALAGHQSRRQVRATPRRRPFPAYRRIRQVRSHPCDHHRRPLALFTGDNVSGESLQQRESGLVAQAKRRPVIFGNAWEDCMYLAVKLNRLYGTADIAPDVVISTKWGDVETRNEEAHRQAVRRLPRRDHRPGQAWDELGLSEEAQTAMLERRRLRAHSARWTRSTS